MNKIKQLLSNKGGNVIVSLVLGMVFVLLLPVNEFPLPLFLTPILFILGYIFLGLIEQNLNTNFNNGGFWEINPFRILVLLYFIVYLGLVFTAGIPYLIYRNGEPYLYHSSVFPDRPYELETARLVITLAFASIIYALAYISCGFIKRNEQLHP